MSFVAVCLSGRIGSGKTSVSHALARDRDAAIASFGAYVRSVAAAEGLDSSDRVILQDRGAKLIADYGHEWLCAQVLAMANWQKNRDLVIEGVRHVAVLEAIKAQVAPIRTVLVHLALTSESDLLARAAARGLAPEQRAQVELHSTERDVHDALPQAADLLVQAERPIEDVVASIRAFLSSDI